MINSIYSIYAKFAALFVLALSMFALNSCSDDDDDANDKQTTFKMAIVADPHYYDPSLGTTSEDFQKALAGDRKMFVECKSINDAAIAMIKNEDVDFVVVAGDLTKDGEKINHEKFAAYCAEIEASGKKVYVVPGNHDVNNPHSYKYPDGAAKTSEPTVTAAEFEQIYNDFGFADAIARDPNSLTYVVEPQNGIWLIMMDPCNYDDRFPDISRTAGKFSEDNLLWIKNKISEGVDAGKTVFGCMHHGIVEHFPSMDMIFEDYLVRDWKTIAQDFASLGMRVVFTGHHHATDISKLEDGGDYIFDVQTGSLVTWTSPYRVVNFDSESKIMQIENILIEDISYDLSGVDFQTYAEEFLESGLPPLIVAQLQGMGLSEAEAQAASVLVTPTMMAYYRGDETLHADQTVISGVNQMISAGGMQAMLGGLLMGIWNDPTLDGDVMIDLSTGAISAK